MAPRAYWKGYLKLSLVSCPVALFPASSEREKISFHQLNKNTGNRIKYRKVDAETGDEVESADIIKGYEVGKGQYLQIQKNSKRLPSRASALSTSISSFHEARLTNCIRTIPTSSCRMVKWVNKHLP
jgi:DNA end-binding protein Ku